MSSLVTAVPLRPEPRRVDDNLTWFIQWRNYIYIRLRLLLWWLQPAARRILSPVRKAARKDRSWSQRLPSIWRLTRRCARMFAPALMLILMISRWYSQRRVRQPRWRNSNIARCRMWSHSLLVTTSARRLLARTASPNGKIRISSDVRIPLLSILMKSRVMWLQSSADLRILRWQLSLILLLSPVCQLIHMLRLRWGITAVWTSPWQRQRQVRQVISCTLRKQLSWLHSMARSMVPKLWRPNRWKMLPKVTITR